MKAKVWKLFQWISYLEGTSFLVLLCIAMPLKYMADRPIAVTVTGGIHGFFFALYLIAVAVMTVQNRWKAGRVAGAVIASLLPLGPFIFERRLANKAR